MQNNIEPRPFYMRPAKTVSLNQAQPKQRAQPHFHGAHLNFQPDSDKPLNPALPSIDQDSKATASAPHRWVTAQDYCQKAKSLLNKRQWRSAQVVLQKGLLEVQKTATAYHLLGLALYHQGLFQQALLQIEKACDKDPKPEYFLNLSLILNEIGRYQQAQSAYEKASQLKHQSLEQNWKELITKRHQQTAETYLQNHQFEPALKEYIKGLKFYPQPSAHLQIARLLWKLNQKKTAEKYLQSFISLNPKNIPARLLLASWYFEQEQIPQAVNEWETVLRMDPKNPSANNCLLKVQQMSEWS